MTGVLTGVRVVELASWTYVPAAGVALADWGADVIKVESVVGGDPGRALVVGGFTRQAARADTDFILELASTGTTSPRPRATAQSCNLPSNTVWWRDMS
jgi:crotonobetainyl-CoA:carnitine CoA-transferase CaiB-like acyl-CoA transferase